jgi:hypothetical protein
VNDLRLELTTLPARIAALPVLRGYPVPWFVAQVDGQYDFRVADAEKRSRAVSERLCWVCGQQLGAYLCFVVGPMCGISRTTAEPPCHRECATWSAKNCPFLTRPQMVRREADLPSDACHPGGVPILRNPGVTLLWVTKSYRTWVTDRKKGEWLIRIGEPEEVEWFAEGRRATRSEALASVQSGFPALLEIAEEQGRAAIRELEAAAAQFERLMPAEVKG